MKRVSRVTIAVLALVAVAAVAAGCGGSGDHHHKRAQVSNASGTAKIVPLAAGAGVSAADAEDIKTCASPPKPFEDSPLGHPCDLQPAMSSQQTNDWCREWGCYSWYYENNTPYTMTINPVATSTEVNCHNNCRSLGWQQVPNHRDWVFFEWIDHQPPRTLEPGQRVRMYEVHCFGNAPQSWVSYTYTANADEGGDGKEHMVTFGDHAACQPLVSGFTSIWNNDRWDPDGFAQTRPQPNAPANTEGVFLKDPKLVTIDAKTNPEGAAAALEHVSDSASTDLSFIPDRGGPTWVPANKVAKEPGTPTLINESSQPATLSKGQSITNAATTKISEEVSVDTEFALLASVKEAVSASSSQAWTDSDTTQTTISAKADPGKQLCLVKQVGELQYTGEVKFTWWGIPFDIKNATFETPSGNGKVQTLVGAVQSDFPAATHDPSFKCSTADTTATGLQPLPDRSNGN